MRHEQNFLITYGLQNFVTYAQCAGRHIFTIHSTESPKMISHAQSLIAGIYGKAVDIQVA